MAILLRIILFLGVLCFTLSENTKLYERFSWKQVDFDFPDENARANAIQSGDYVPENNIPLGLERWKNKLFVTFPSFKKGIAATLTYIDLETTYEKSPKLKPYPNWDAHRLRDKNRVGKIVSVYRLSVDVCDRLWLVDRGIVDSYRTRQVVHQPKIQIYNLNTDELLKEYTIPKDQLPEKHYLANIIADVSRDGCDKAFAYMADIGTNALIVYSLQTDESWRVTHDFFHFDPIDGDYNVAGINFQWSIGIFGLALSPTQANGYRTLYFHPMSSHREFAVSTKIIQNKTIASKAYHEYKLLGTREPNTQSAGSSLDEATGVLFYTLLNKNGIGCWNSKNSEYSARTNALIASDKNTMIFPNDLKVDKMGTLWVLTDLLSNFTNNKLNFNDVNFRIFSAPAREVIKDTVCDKDSFSTEMIFNPRSPQRDNFHAEEVRMGPHKPVSCQTRRNIAWMPILYK